MSVVLSFYIYIYIYIFTLRFFVIVADIVLQSVSFSTLSG